MQQQRAKTHSEKLRKTLVDAIFTSPIAPASLELLKTPNREPGYTGKPYHKTCKLMATEAHGSKDRTCPFRNFPSWCSFQVMAKCFQPNALAEMNISSERGLLSLNPALIKGFLVLKTMTRD